MLNNENDDSVLTLLNAFGRTIGVASVYGVDHPLSLNAISQTHLLITDYLKNHSSFRIGVQNRTLLVNGTPIKKSLKQWDGLIDALEHLEIFNLKINKEITKEEVLFLFRNFAKSRHSKSSCTFEEGIEHPHLISEKGKFCLIREGEEVKEHAKELETDRRDREIEESIRLELNNLIAFIRGGDDDGGNEKSDSFIKAKEEVAKLAKNPEKMAKILLESVAIRQRLSSIEGETLDDIVVGCLRRTYKLLQTHPNYKKKKAARAMRKSLVILEEQLLEKLRGKEENTQEERQLYTLFNRAKNQFLVEEKMWRCAETHKSYQRAQQELNNLMQGKGFSKNLLREGDSDLLPEQKPSEEWMQMVLRENPELKKSQMGLEQLETIASTLDKLETLVEQLSKPSITQTSSYAKKTDENVIIDGKAEEMSRRELLRIIAELTQELMQPTTSIMITLEMLIRGFAGKLLPEQYELLDIAGHQGDQLTYLLKRLLEIVGVPVNKGVDPEFKHPN